MNIVNRLTLRHLKANKGRTVVTILGITVSVAMITAVFVSVASFMKLYGDISYLSGGKSEAMFYGMSAGQYADIQADDRVACAGLSGNSENFSSFRLENRKSDRTGTGDFYVGNVQNLTQKFTGEYEGEIPQNDREIAVEQELLEKNNLDWKIGDEVEIPVGLRCIMDEGQKVVTGGNWYNGEFFEEQETKTFRITAILHENPATRGYDIVRGMGEEETKGENLCVSVTLKEVNHKSLEVLRDMMDTYGVTDYELNDGYLESKFAVDENSILMGSLLPTALVVLALIVIASVMLIYNAFGMSLSERVRYLGMLASVGATKKQKQRSVYFEGMVLGCVGIPLGILSGIGGISITLKLTGHKIIATGMINGVSDSGMGMTTVVPLWAVAGIILFSILTIFISAFIPARKASRISPIDAIRQTQSIRLKKKKLRTPGYVRWIFGYEGELAHKNLKRNGGRARMITLSLAMSVILFLSVNYFCELFVQSNDMAMEVPYQVEAIVAYEDRGRFVEEALALPEAEAAYVCTSVYCDYDGKNQTENPNRELFQENYLTDTYKKLADAAFGVYVNAVEDRDFDAMLAANNLNRDDFYGDTLKGVLLNNISHREGGAEVFRSEILGQTFYTGQETESGGIEIAGLVSFDQDNYLYRLSPKNNPAIYVPESMYYKCVYGDYEKDQVTVSIGIETREHKKVAEEVSALLEENNYSRGICLDLVDSMESMNTIVFILQVFTYGFIALITLITAANIINTISTGIALRRKEFAMLKSVGITPAGFYKMICLESLFYGLKALIVGLPASLFVSCGLNALMNVETIPLQINGTMYLAVTLAVFFLTGMTMLYAVSRLKRDSIAETLKKDMDI